MANFKQSQILQQFLMKDSIFLYIFIYIIHDCVLEHFNASELRLTIAAQVSITVESFQASMGDFPDCTSFCMLAAASLIILQVPEFTECLPSIPLRTVLFNESY